MSLRSLRVPGAVRHDVLHCRPGTALGTSPGPAMHHVVLHRIRDTAVPLELHRRGGLDRLAVVAEVEERARREAECAGEQGGRELLDAGVVLVDRVVEEAA